MPPRTARPVPRARPARAPVRRPRRGAQGPAGPAARLRGAARARRQPAGRSSVSSREDIARARSPTRTRCARSTPSAPVGRDALWRALAARRRPLRAVALGRELRDGPDRGLRGRHPGRRLRRSPATPTSSATASTESCPARRSAASRRGASAARTPSRRGAPSWCERRASSAERYAWPRVAARVEQVYERAIETPQPQSRRRRGFRRRSAFVPADGLPRGPRPRLPSLDPPPPAVSRSAVDRAPRRGRHRPASSALGSPSSPPSGSGSTTSSRAPSAPTSPGSSSRRR